jgi:hypothetical protein
VGLVAAFDGLVSKDGCPVAINSFEGFYGLLEEQYGHA